MRKLYFLFLLGTTAASAQQSQPLTVDYIMRDQKWLGVAPENYRWSADSKTVYFDWNPENKAKNELYQVGINANKPLLADVKNADAAIVPAYLYNADRSLALVEQAGDLFLHEFKSKKKYRLTQTTEREANASFLGDGTVAFQRGDNLFVLNPRSGELKQMTNFVRNKKSEAKVSAESQDGWLKKDQLELFDVLKAEKKANPMQFRAALVPEKALKAIDLKEAALAGLVISPDGRYITYRLLDQPARGRQTIVPAFVTESGYTTDIPGRTKVGEPLAASRAFVYDRNRDSIYQVQTAQIPGIKDLPDYLKDYPEKLAAAKTKAAERGLNIFGPFWNNKGTTAVIAARSQDNKDFWILKLDAATGQLSLIDRQRDEAWIAGPGIGARNIFWINNEQLAFQSEASGYSHIYVADVAAGTKKQLTQGKWEVKDLRLSADSKFLYFSGNIEHPGISHFYKLNVAGGNPVKITSMKGGNEVTLSPDEKWLAINYSYMNKPWELYIQENKPGAKARQITASSSAEFKAYNWKEPEMVSFKNRHGDDVYARVYPAVKPHPSRPAVVFVHGAGYLQNVHYWWSQYSREYMFHNLLADQGYTVIDIDYTGSAGYGRNHRTGIYRHMGGKDLTDQADGVKMLVEKYNVNPANVGLYGGSYGGFITLMALFNEADVFASGAALRSVTDWAHYNHGYTANILNEPLNDPLAYKRSSPIYFADKLKGNLLMAHGMVDVNVHFQDIVRLSQRFIELGKNNWELAVYPVEDHGFVQPSSWTDEYKRIYKLFENTLKK